LALRISLAVLAMRELRQHSRDEVIRPKQQIHDCRIGL
jgi:hypothetical protein